MLAKIKLSQGNKTKKRKATKAPLFPFLKQAFPDLQSEKIRDGKDSNN
jgi:hypothetical protein